MVVQFPAKKNAGCPKAPRDFPPRKDGILYPHRVVLGLPSPFHRVCVDGWTYRCTDVRTDGQMTITSQPKFLGLIGYQISLAMELRWRALPAGSATTPAPRLFTVRNSFVSAYHTSLSFVPCNVTCPPLTTSSQCSAIAFFLLSSPFFFLTFKQSCAFPFSSSSLSCPHFLNPSLFYG